MTENIVLTNSEYTITIYTTKVEENTINNITKLPIPTTTEVFAETQSPTDTILVNLLRIEKSFNVTGHILYADRAILRKLRDFIGTLSMTYSGGTFSVIIEKCTIMEIPSDEDTPTKFDVQINMTVGKLFGSS